MEVLLARQPIFDKKMKVFGYELLYRGMMGRDGSFFDGDRATSEVIINSFQVMDIESLTVGKRAFINFTENLLKEEIPHFLSKDKVIIEILENVKIDDLIVSACRELKKAGYIIALDDFVFENLHSFNEILPYVDIIKVDFLENEFSDSKKRIMDVLSKKNLKFLAEKVETQEQYALALEWGFDFFQGYFFEKPYLIMGKDIEFCKMTHLQMMAEVNNAQDFDKLSEILKQDVGLSYKLLRLINSPFYARSNKIKSAKQALVMLGLDEVKKWLILLMLRDSGRDKPDELIKISLIRAKFAEDISEIFGLEERKSELFLMGLFSTLDAILDKPMEEVVKYLPMEKDILESYEKQSQTIFAKILDIVKHYEKGLWKECDALMEIYSLDPRIINAYFFDAVLWSENVLETINR